MTFGSAIGAFLAPHQALAILSWVSRTRWLSQLPREYSQMSQDRLGLSRSAPGRQIRSASNRRRRDQQIGTGCPLAHLAPG